MLDGGRSSSALDLLNWNVLWRKTSWHAQGLENWSNCQLIEGLTSANIFSKFLVFRTGLKKQGKFLSNVLEMIETMFLFMRGTKQQLWNLHPAALEKFSKYFYALDLQNYAGMTPVYLATMHSLRNEDLDTWTFLSRNFCCSKTPEAFVSIGDRSGPLALSRTGEQRTEGDGENRWSE